MRRLVLPAVAAVALALVVSAQAPPKWDVQAPFGPTIDVSFDTTEGTWMNLDVSPDGRRLVFDILGDIYTMPIEGGTATRILGGAAFEMQPRFSPNGERIAFTSDRDGLWNIWTMKADGTDLKQISRERQWFVNSPTWGPDGMAIYARRHFVTTRSLGAGEIWMYHPNGSTGLQISTRETQQKDLGEPAVSPDGKYLYYSKDVTPGALFEYNKDPNGVIFAILRRDLTTGRETTLASRPGGSVTPRPSPDGKLLAFIRRVRLGSQLFVKDVATNVDTPVFDKLDKDLQEAWTVQGVYPQYAWTPDNRSVVIWGQGKIWKVDVAGRTGAEIPFTARVQQTIHSALRVPVKVHEDQFPVRMLRDISVSPDGSQVAFSALGRLYIRRIGQTDEPQRVTAGGSNAWDDAIELDPTWSPDGRQILFTTWHDQRLGRVAIVDVGSKAVREIVSTPGHYIEPAYSPDGRWIVYRKAGSDGVRTVDGALEPGIYIVPVDRSSPPKLVREGGVEPMFDHAGKRVYFQEQRAQFVLASVNLEGTEEVMHAQSANAFEIVPSPDGKWIAFHERFRVFVAPFARVGRPMELSPAMTGFPVVAVSRDAGFFLHWSRDSQRLHWALGPELFSRDISRWASLLSGSAQAVDPPESKGVPIGFTAKADVPAGQTALTGARIVTMAASGATPAVIDNGVILIDGPRIAAVGPANRVAIPAGARRIDVRGKTIVPGFIDAHAHVGAEGAGIPTREAWPLMANLAFGVTTLHDPSNDLEMVFANSEMIRAGLKLGPRLYSTGRILYGAETNFKAFVDTYDDALAHIRRLKAIGAWSVKSYNQQRRDARQMLMKAARELNMNVVPEGGSLYYMNATHVQDGHTTVEHNLPVPSLYNDIVQIFAKSGVGYTPTLIVAYGALNGEFYWYQHMDVWAHERLMQFTPRDVVDPRSRRRLMAEEADYGHVLPSKSAKRLSDSGVLVNVGAHGQLQGLGYHWEMWNLAQGGMTPMDMLRAATMNPAKSLGLDQELGSIEVGKLADLVVLDRNPLENIRYTDSVFRVVLNGRVYDTSLTEVGGPAWAEDVVHGKVKSGMTAPSDVIVVGLGAMGSAALYQLAKRGVSVTGIDRFAPPHDRGSSHGESRITRQAIGEGEEYVPFALRSHEIWRELEAETGRSLFSPIGGLIIGRRTDSGIHGHADFIGRTIAAAKRFRIEHEVMTPGEVTKRFPQFRLAGDETCYYEPGAGFLRPELCVETQIDRARELGATVRTGEVVTRVTADATSVTVVTNTATYTAARVIVTAGAWVPQLLGGAYAKVLRVYPQTLFWFAPDEAAAFRPGRFPIFIWRHGAGEDDHFYGFPVVGAGVKLATEQFTHTIGPDDARPTPTSADPQRMYDALRMHEEQVRGRLMGVSPRCVRSVTCLYTVTPGFGFLIDRHPEWEHVLVASPCSGHGFKHSAAIGEALAERVTTGASRLDLTPFSLARFGALE